MNLPGYYSSGQFARLANVTVRTIRYYDKHNILKPSYLNENGARFYTDEDLARLQKILLFKYLGFSLDDIRRITIEDTGKEGLADSLHLQQKLIEDRIEQMQLVKKAILDTADLLEQGKELNWSQMLDLIHLTNMENSMATQYNNASNLSARIRLHALYSENPKGWFPWLFEQCRLIEHRNILELGCGSGALWAENLNRIPDQVHITLSDISTGMLRDARRNIGEDDSRFSFQAFNCHQIPFPDHSFDLVIANHLLFYCDDIAQVCMEAARVLTEDGVFICSTYSREHMKEITSLVQEFDSRIVLSADTLYERFGLENGRLILENSFFDIRMEEYPDRLLVTRPEPLIEYILSCHGNQNQYLLDRYQEFRQFVEQKTKKGFSVTKKAGIFISRKKST